VEHVHITGSYMRYKRNYNVLMKKGKHQKIDLHLQIGFFQT